MGRWRRGGGGAALALLAGLATPVTAGAAPGQEPPRITVRVLGDPVDWPRVWPTLNTPVLEEVSERGHVLVPTTTDTGAVTTGVWARGRLETVPTPPDMMPGTGLSGQDISNRGQVVGLYSVALSSESSVCSFDPAGEVRFACPVPVSWSGGELTRLPTPSGSGWAFDVNDRGQVAGRLAAPPGSPPEAYGDVVWDDGEVVRPPGPHEVHIDEDVESINNRGQVLVDWMEDDEQHFGIWQVGGDITELDGGGAATMLMHLNDRGDVVGYAGGFSDPGPPDSTHVVLWRDGERLDLGSFGGSVWRVELTDGGRLLVEVDRPDGVHAVIWDGGEVTDVGALPDDVSLVGMNDRGQVIATRWGDGLGDGQAVLWQDGLWIDLPRPEGIEGDVLASDINDRGQIAGRVGPSIAAGADAPVLWTVPRRGAS